MIKLIPYEQEETEMLALIKAFWFEHNNELQTDEEAKEDLLCWCAKGHRLYFILAKETQVGFLHLGSRGAAIDWLEDIFVLPPYQGQGIGAHAISLAEQMVRTYSQSMYIEAAARNEAAISLYRKLGYDCLNTISLRKDFPGYTYDVVKKEQIHGHTFEIRKNPSPKTEEK